MNNVPVIGKGIKDIQVDVPSKEVTVTYDSAKTSPEELIKGFGKIRVKAEEKTCQIVIYGLVNLMESRGSKGIPAFFFDRRMSPQGRGIRSEQNGRDASVIKEEHASYHWYFRTFPRSLRRQYSTVCCVLENIH